MSTKLSARELAASIDTLPSEQRVPHDSCCAGSRRLNGHDLAVVRLNQFPPPERTGADALARCRRPGRPANCSDVNARTTPSGGRSVLQQDARAAAKRSRVSLMTRGSTFDSAASDRRAGGDFAPERALVGDLDAAD
jgi:hypothetical protein